MKVAIAGFQHETNTFSDVKTTYEHFLQADAWPKMLLGDEVIAIMRDQNIPVAGFINAALKDDAQLLPIFWCSATPSGIIESAAYDKITSLLIEQLKSLKDIDAIYLDLHGAMVSEKFRDGDGHLLQMIREEFPDLIIISSLDLHANISEAMLIFSDQLAVYRSYPHVDMYETGERAWRYMKSIFTNKNKIKKALKKIPFLIPMVAQSTLSEPGESLYRFMQDYEQEHHVHLDFAQGFPLADVAEVGPTIIAYADTVAAAKSALSDFYKKIVEKQDQYNVKYFSPIEAVKKAKALTADANEKVILVDTQDNAGCGGTGDTTGLLQAMCDQSLENSILGLLCDPEVAKLAHKEGIGATFKTSLGAKVFTQGIAPVVGEFEVLALSDGKFKATGPFYLNMQMDLGPMALLKINQVKVVVSSRKAQAADQAMFVHLGVDFTREKVIALKSTVHYQADFNALAKTHLIIETPGSNIANLGRLSYKYAK